MKSDPQLYIPIFVGSTFVDLKSYREAVIEALHRLEVVVRGMESFGSRPGSPIEECLAVVQSCKVYIGIFGMRYGSIPDGFERSITHLEYDEAQRIGLPSLIYVIDAERQPVLPVHVETGEGAAQLANFKAQLRKRHTVSVFTTEDDLAKSVLADLPTILKKVGANRSGEMPAPSAAQGRVVRPETLWYLPDWDRNPHFVGRSSEIQMLREQLLSGRIAALNEAPDSHLHRRIAALVGLGGIGKTQTAVE